jgi:CBS domain-containing protein
MNIGELCNREVIVANRDDSVLAAAKLMREYHVGDVVVVEQRGQGRVPVGILTDRDIVVELIATEVDTKTVTVSDAMSTELLTVREDDDISDMIEQMRGKAVRRVPVVDVNDALVGIVTVDDVIDVMAEQFDALVSLVQREKHREQIVRSRA